MATRFDMLFGKLAVKEGIVPADTVEEATSDLGARLDGGETVYLWTVLVDNGMISKRQADNLLKLIKESIRECPKCSKFADLRSKRGDPSAGCSRCGGPLLELQLPEEEPPKKKTDKAPKKGAPQEEKPGSLIEEDLLLSPDLAGVDPGDAVVASEASTEVEGGGKSGEDEFSPEVMGEPQPTRKDAVTKRVDSPKPGGREGKLTAKAGPTLGKGAGGGGAGGKSSAGGKPGGITPRAAPKSQQVTCPICDKQFGWTRMGPVDRAECPKCHTQFEPKDE